MAKIIEVIETYENRGTGVKDDPIRQIYQLWSKDGELIYEKYDEFEKGYVRQFEGELNDFIADVIDLSELNHKEDKDFIGKMKRLCEEHKKELLEYLK